MVLALWEGFDRVEKRGESVILARSKRSEDFAVEFDLVPDRGASTSATFTVKVSAKVPYLSLAESITQSIVELEVGSRAISIVSGGMAPIPNEKGVTLTVRINKPPEVSRRSDSSRYQTSREELTDSE